MKRSWALGAVKKRKKEQREEVSGSHMILEAEFTTF